MTPRVGDDILQERMSEYINHKPQTSQPPPSIAHWSNFSGVSARVSQENVEKLPTVQRDVLDWFEFLPDPLDLKPEGIPMERQFARRGEAFGGYKKGAIKNNKSYQDPSP